MWEFNISEFEGKIIDKIKINIKESLVQIDFILEDGRYFCIGNNAYENDELKEVTLESIDGNFSDLINSVVISTESSIREDNIGQWTTYRIITKKGKVTFKWLVVDKKEDIKDDISSVYDDVYFINNLGATVLNDKWGVIDREGNELIPLKYNNIFILSGELVSVNLNGKWGIMNILNKTIVPIIYDNCIWEIYENLVKAKLNGNVGFVDIINPSKFIKFDIIEKTKTIFVYYKYYNDKYVISLKDRNLFGSLFEYENFINTKLKKGRRPYREHMKILEGLKSNEGINKVKEISCLAKEEEWLKKIDEKINL